MSDLDRHPLSEVTVSTIVQVLERSGVGNTFLTGVKPVTGSTSMIGRARTLRCLPVRRDIQSRQLADPGRTPHRKAFDGVEPGQVLVIDARGVTNAAVLGDLLAGRIAAANGRGIVTDGAVRDSLHLRKLPLPVFAAGEHAATFGTRHIGMEVDLAVACGGVLIAPGDYIVGDAEGVVCVPQELADQVGTEAAEQEFRDVAARHQLLEGFDLTEAYPEENTSMGNALREGEKE